jgi:hypothetical protein
MNRKNRDHMEEKRKNEETSMEYNILIKKEEDKKYQNDRVT